MVAAGPSGVIVVHCCYNGSASVAETFLSWCVPAMLYIRTLPAECSTPAVVDVCKPLVRSEMGAEVRKIDKHTCRSSESSTCRYEVAYRLSNAGLNRVVYPVCRTPDVVPPTLRTPAHTVSVLARDARRSCLLGCTCFITPSHDQNTSKIRRASPAQA